MDGNNCTPEARLFSEFGLLKNRNVHTGNRKRICTPLCPPPRPPSKSCPPVRSRVFKSPVIIGPRLVSCSVPDRSVILESPHYDRSKQDSFFDQCFESLGILGFGSFGNVYKAKCKDDGKLYAIKMSREHFRGKCDRRRKVAEVQTFEKIGDHDNIVKFYRAWEEDGCLYIQMELCEVSLQDLCQTVFLFSNIVWKFFVDILFGIKHMHDQDWIHLDIKPENIFVSEGVCKLGDLGLALYVAKGKDLSESMEGDSNYMAPELLEGIFHKPADIFSCGKTVGRLSHTAYYRYNRDDDRCDYIPDGDNSLYRLWGIVDEMTLPDYSRRPTVDELLELNCMQEVTNGRLVQRPQMLRSTSTSRDNSPDSCRTNDPETSTVGESLRTDDEDMVEDSDTSVLALPLENSKDDDDARDLCDEVDGDHFNCLVSRCMTSEPGFQRKLLTASTPYPDRNAELTALNSPLLDRGSSQLGIRCRVLFEDVPSALPPESRRLRRVQPTNLMLAFECAGESDDEDNGRH